MPVKITIKVKHVQLPIKSQLFTLLLRSVKLCYWNKYFHFHFFYLLYVSLQLRKLMSIFGKTFLIVKQKFFFFLGYKNAILMLFLLRNIYINSRDKAQN